MSGTGVDILIVGNSGGTNVGASLERAALAQGLRCRLLDATAATAGPRVAVTLSWRLLGHRPLHLTSFSRAAVEACRVHHPKILIATGQAPLDAASLAEIGSMGIVRVNYSTDDPWNPTHRAAWFLDALRQYDRIFSTREANLADFRAHGCTSVSWLPFGFDAGLWLDGPDPAVPVGAREAGVFFAGAAEKFRVECIRAIAAAGIGVALAGDYWKRVPDLRKYSLGSLPAGQLRAWTRNAPVALCLVRRANRDGHVMRSFEIPAIGACMIAEDTQEHRRIFGGDGEAVRYFRTAGEAAALSAELLADSATRQRLAESAKLRITEAANTYADRLEVLTARDAQGSESGNPKQDRAAGHALFPGHGSSAA